jgi:hypothetical protein
MDLPGCVCIPCCMEWDNNGTFKADSHIACRAHAVPLPCRDAKGLECLFHLIYTVRPCLIHTCHAAPMPCSDDTVLLKATAQHGRLPTEGCVTWRRSIWTETCRSDYTNVLIVSFNIFVLIKCAFVGHKKTLNTYVLTQWEGVISGTCSEHLKEINTKFSWKRLLDKINCETWAKAGV